MARKNITISIDEWTLDTLDKFAKPRSISRSQLIRLAVEEYVRNHTYPESPVTNVTQES